MNESSNPPDSQSTEAGDEISLLDLAVVVVENLRLLVVGPLLVGLIALGYAFTITPIFTARTSFLPPQQQQSAAAAALSQLGALAAAGLKSPAELYVAFLRSATVADRIIDRFKLMESFHVTLRQEARARLDGRTKITAGRDGLIVLEVNDESPQRAADIANAYVTELEALLGRLALTEAQYRSAYYEKQLEKTKTALTAAESALGAIGVGPGAIKSIPQTTVDVVARLNAQVTAQEVKLAGMRGYLTESAPEFRQALTELAALRAQLKKGEANEPAAASSGGYVEKYRNFKYQEMLFDVFKRQFELAKADEAREGAVIQVVDVALPPEYKSYPSKALIAVLTTLVAGILLLVWIFLRKAIADRAVRPEEASKLAAIRSGFSRFARLGREQRR